jgi:hypothetical protein
MNSRIFKWVAIALAAAAIFSGVLGVIEFILIGAWGL